MQRVIKKVAVLGAGIMGRGIAAHLANAGIPSLLLDIVPKNSKDRNQLAKGAFEEIKKSSPALLYSQRDLSLITPGNFDDDFHKINDCDWVVEAVVERLDIKQSLYEKIEKVLKKDLILSSNTSGLPLSQLVQGRSAIFKKNFLITHFFNPVRYMKLVEIVSGPETSPQALKTMAAFLEDVLGKGVVYGKDTPNFVANRIGIFAMMTTIRKALEEGYTVEEVDKILGPASGRPKSAVFRTVDLVGLDTLVYAARNTHAICTNDERRAVFEIPEILEKMIQDQRLGAKTGKGFYQKVKAQDGTSEIHSMNLQTMGYGPQQKVRFDSLGVVRNIDDPALRIKTLVWAEDRAGQLAWKSLSETLLYSAHRIPEIAEDIVNIDNAMKWGFNWELGPFETWDAIGVKEAVERLKKEGQRLPKIVEAVLTKGEGKFYKSHKGQNFFFDALSETYKPFPQKTDLVVLKEVRAQKKLIKQGASASLLDIGDGVACLEFHSKMNAVDDDILQMAHWSVDEVEKNFHGMVIHNEGPHFCAGANVMLLYMEAQQKNWVRIDEIIRAFQTMTMRFRYSSKPVVAAPFNMTLGGGCEIAMGADRIRAHAETYIGLVELGVGLIPAGGGCKEMLLRWEEKMKKGFENFPTDLKKTWWTVPPNGGAFQKVRNAFETIGFAKVSTSAKEAFQHGYFREGDQITLSRERVLSDAKKDVLKLSKNYRQPVPRSDIEVPGEGGWYAIQSAVSGFKDQGLISEYDAFLANKLAYVLTAGNHKHPTQVAEQDILDLEREVFLSLCGEAKTHERIQHILMNGKPLRN